MLHTEPPLSVLESMVTLRLHLDEITPENGPLQVASGTHRTGKTLLLDGYPQHTICTAAETSWPCPRCWSIAAGAPIPPQRGTAGSCIGFSRTRDLPGEFAGTSGRPLTVVVYGLGRVSFHQ